MTYIDNVGIVLPPAEIVRELESKKGTSNCFFMVFVNLYVLLLD